MKLHGRLHADVLCRSQVLRRHEVVRERRLVAVDRPVAAKGVVRHLLLDLRPVGLQHLAGVGEREHRLDAGGDVVGHEGDGPCGRNRG